MAHVGASVPKLGGLPRPDAALCLLWFGRMQPFPGPHWLAGVMAPPPLAPPEAA